jgi:uncharacterized protein (TIGR02217 family)
MAHYDDVILSTAVDARDITSGLTDNVETVFLAGGGRETNRRWTKYKRTLNIAFTVRPQETAYAIRRVWQAVGPANSFLTRDWNDWNTTAGKMEQGDESFITNVDQPVLELSAPDQYQLVKVYGEASATTTRTITKPANDGNIKVSVDEGGGPLDLTEGADFTVDYSTGIVTLLGSPTPSGSPSAVRWGGAFYVPVAFAQSDISQRLAGYRASGFPDVQLIEVFL